MAKPTLPDVKDAFMAYRERHPEWGSLHIVLADGNVEDRFVRWVIDQAQEAGDVEGERLAHILLGMTKTQRLKLPFCLTR